MGASETTTGVGPGDHELAMVTFRRRGAAEIVEAISRFSTSEAEAAFNRAIRRPLADEPSRFEGNRHARRKAAAEARRGAVVMEPIRFPEPKASVPPGLVRFIEGLGAVAKSVAKSDATRLLATKAMLAAEHTAEWMQVQMFEGGRIVDTATPEQRAAREAACAEEWERIKALEWAAEEPAGKPASGRDADLPAVWSAHG